MPIGMKAAEEFPIVSVMDLDLFDVIYTFIRNFARNCHSLNIYIYTLISSHLLRVTHRQRYA